MASHVNPVYEYRRPADLDAPAVRHPVIVVGAGPVGLVAAIDLAQRGVPVVVLDEDCTVSVGSRAICYAKRTLEILDRLGCGERVAQKGVQWHVGRVYFRDAQAYQFDLLPEAGHRRPAFVNRSNITSRRRSSIARARPVSICAGATRSSASCRGTMRSTWRSGHRTGRTGSRRNG